MHLRMIQESAFDVSAIQQQLDAHPEVWNTITHRTEHLQSPHREIDDIWVRYNPVANYHGDMRQFNAEHTPEWYAVVDELPAVKTVSEALMERLEGKALGAVLVTRIPPGHQVYPHIDQGWHARHYQKFCIQIRGNCEQSFHFEGEELRTVDGDLFWFDNSFPHWVKNPSQTERISLIVCIRR